MVLPAVNDNQRRRKVDGGTDTAGTRWYGGTGSGTKARWRGTVRLTEKQGGRGSTHGQVGSMGRLQRGEEMEEEMEGRGPAACVDGGRRSRGALKRRQRWRTWWRRTAEEEPTGGRERWGFGSDRAAYRWGNRKGRGEGGGEVVMGRRRGSEGRGRWSRRRTGDADRRRRGFGGGGRWRSLPRGVDGKKERVDGVGREKGCGGFGSQAVAEIWRSEVLASSEEDEGERAVVWSQVSWEGRGDRGSVGLGVRSATKGRKGEESMGR